MNRKNLKKLRFFSFYSYILLGDIMNEVYIVKRGDTLYGISNQFGVSVTELASLNKVDASSLQVGQTLLIPAKSGTNPDNMFLYTVKKGDTLYGIAKLYNISTDEIKKLNYLTNNDIYVGQVIRIPEMYTKQEDMYVPDYGNYVVQKGDTLYSIAKKFDTTVDRLLQDNGLISPVLRVGQNLKIRGLVGDNVLECFGESDNNPLSQGLEYIVKKGDTLYSIAKKYGISVPDLIRINSLNNNNLVIGQVLFIPSSSKTYIVKKGDTLYSIAKKFQTTIDSLKEKNQLTNNILTIGQVLNV